MKNSSTCFAFVLAFLCFNNALANKDCLKLDFSVTQDIQGYGFHRVAKWLIEASLNKEQWVKSLCEIIFHLNLPPPLFVNPDEVADLKRLNKLDVVIDGAVDIEVPAHKATEHNVYVFFNNSQIEKLPLSLPIHLRYQRAQITGGFAKVSFPKPSLLTWCPKSQHKICGKEVKAPVLHMTSTKIWYNISYKALFDDIELYVPVGDLDHYPIVAISTLLLGCAGCIYILSILSTTHL
ncbi:uncharacterized protein LOC132699196 [Cylas formicarius]|uniref:uncharacterized protein LOC132699196 n=1 Tax=Cylas formicarius TaxID=197179 RepID=UPI002958DE10|nr:uncharacterized protein LOC132699196 [Cylas formicarius]